MNCMNRVFNISQGSNPHHAYIIYGQYCDKLGIVMRGVKDLGCKRENFDILKVHEGERSITIAQIKDLRRHFSLTGFGKGWRIAIIDQADRMTTEAQNALLKILEEPPAKTIMILLAEEEGAILETVSSRCHKIRLAPSMKILQSMTQPLPKALIDGKWSIGQRFQLADKMSKDETIVAIMDRWLIELGEYAKKDVKNSRYLRLIKSMQVVKKMLKSNTNRRLILENMFLDF